MYVIGHYDEGIEHNMQVMIGQVIPRIEDNPAHWA
jgi:hypothetical protein